MDVWQRLHKTSKNSIKQPLGVIGVVSVSVPAIVGVFLVYCGLSRLVAAVIGLPGEPTLAVMRAGLDPTVSELRELIESRTAMARYVASGRVHTDLGSAHLTLGELLGGEGVIDVTSGRAAIASLRRGLSLSPVRPFAWARLSFAEAVINGPTPHAAEALEMSFTSAPHERDLSFPRLELGLALWDHLSTFARDAVLSEIRLAWKHDDRRSVVALAHHLARADIAIRAIGDNAEDSAAFNRILQGQIVVPSEVPN